VASRGRFRCRGQPRPAFAYHSLADMASPKGWPSRSSRRARAKAGGEGGIRTPGTVPGSVVFKTTAIDHSATSPFMIGGDPCTPPSSLRYARAAPLAPLCSHSSSAGPPTRRLAAFTCSRSVPAALIDRRGPLPWRDGALAKAATPPGGLHSNPPHCATMGYDLTSRSSNSGCWTRPV
jgi:hypothetical protein